ncbi:MAG TPA: lysophospholipid acyltransferase family protein [Ideonella sp.]|uniref:lysophospholipid acyltransferase family protein n=1 Tax=Ideonella sp. TaxID=1929293 RepID=UPI002BB16BE9|nr:lysophospholipid acyltransferase family protein [Ideonella sp.]HSI46659.1 lysophospholipid acyltransferase family protein [Ideonella sp.]
MIDRLRRLRGLLATALAFGSFGVGGVLLWWVIFPLLTLAVRNPSRRTALARAAVHHLFRAFIGWMRLLHLITYEVRGLARLQRRGLLVLANHPTLIDVVFLISLIDNADCVVKSTLAHNPFTCGAVRATGYICNNSGPELLQDCIDSVKNDGNLIIFPEGTRTRPGQPMKMQRGAAQIALRGGIDITPVFIQCQPLGLTKGAPWWRAAPVPLHFVLTVDDDIPVAPFLAAAGQETALAARHLTDHLIGHFSRVRGSDGSAGT